MAKVLKFKKVFQEQALINQQPLIDALPFYVIIIDSDHRILLANKAVKEHLGVNADKIIGGYCPKVIHGLDDPFPGCPLTEVIKKKQAVEKELYDERYNFWFKSSVYPTELFTAEGKQIFFHTAIDITQQKLLQEDFEFKSFLLDNATDSIFVHDFKGKMIYVNEAAFKKRGYTKKELLSIQLKNLDAPEFAKKIKPRLDLLIKKGFASFESAHLRKDGTIMPIEVHARIIKFRGKKVVASVVRDMTEHKHADEQLRKAQQELEVRVEERTAELSKTNVLLEKEIAQHKEADVELKKSLKKLQKTLHGTVSILASIVEIRDSYTSGHQQRVAQLACAIAKQMKLTEKQVEGIKVAGVLHDIGKIFVPAEILNKPSILSELEFSFIKSHPQVAYDLLKTVDFPWPIAKAVFQHHERIDGSGYPSGILAPQILLEAKILAVADVVEAMSSHRPYRPSLGLEKAFEEIIKNKGKLYDKDVVDNCLKLFKENSFKFNKVV